MRLLFIGNSHTYVNGLPFQVRALADAALGRGVCDPWMVTGGGRSLGWHAEEPGTLLSLRGYPWDVIVLQQRTHPFAGYDHLAADAAKLRPDLDRSGAEIVLYLTWKTREGPAEEQDTLDAAFHRLARAWPARVAPVGPAWRRARAVAPAIELYAADGRHASPAGTYLAACVFCGLLAQRPLPPLPHRIALGETVLADLPPDDAATLQQIAAATLAAGG